MTLAFNRRLGSVFLAAAALVGLSRVYAGVHDPTDVLVWIPIGLVCAYAVVRFLRVPLTGSVRLLSRVSDPIVGLAWPPRSQRSANGSGR